jgi:hypothetical protein
MSGSRPGGVVRAVEIRAERSVAVHADPDLVWRLLRSPAIWSLKATAFMFAVPGADHLRMWVGSTALGLPDNGLYEVDEDDNARSVTFREPAPSRHYYRLAVRPARRGAVKVRIEVARHPSRLRADAVERATHAGLARWLGGIRAVAEGRSPAPGDLISAKVQRLCVEVPPQPQGWISVAEEAVIDADPAPVWAVVYEPHHHPDSSHVHVASGFVPGTPLGRPGEIQYSVVRSADGRLRSEAVVVTDWLDDMDVLSHLLRPPYCRMRYRVTPDNGQARLEVTWSGPPGPGDANRERAAGYLAALLDYHRQTLEGQAG